ncbi:MAG: acetolactate synthase small subunit [Candidatus Pelagibacterales bacterium]|nr:MAG: acetolactate synthase small subunit [Pelagibacterales bacterium]
MIKSAYSFATQKEKIKQHIIVVWVDNETGVLARVVGLFSGRGYNIDSLAVAEVDKKKNISRITIATSGTPQVLQQIKLQLGKLVPVHKVADFPSNKKTLMREMALLKIVASKTQLEKAKNLCKKYKYIILDKTEKSFVFEISALKKEIDDLIKKLQPLGLASASRTGVVAMTKGSEIYQQD